MDLFGRILFYDDYLFSEDARAREVLRNTTYFFLVFEYVSYRMIGV